MKFCKYDSNSNWQILDKPRKNRNTLAYLIRVSDEEKVLCTIDYQVCTKKHYEPVMYGK
jgi:hypothetical protein